MKQDEIRNEVGTKNFKGKQNQKNTFRTENKFRFTLFSSQA